MSTTTNLPAVQESKAVIGLRQTLEANIARIAQTVRGELDPGEVMNTVLELSRQDSKLARCQPDSIVIGTLRACQLRLTLNRDLGHAFLIPRKNGYLTKQAGHDVWEATFQTGYKGVMHMVRKGNPNIHNIKAVIVYREEVAEGRFQMTEGASPMLHHQPSLERLPLDEYVGAYCIVEFKDGSRSDFEWMPRADIERARDVSAAKDDGPWKTWPEEMIKKTVIRRHCKRLELIPEYAERIRRSEAIDLEQTGEEQYGQPAAEPMQMPKPKAQATLPASTPVPPKADPPPDPVCPECGGKLAERKGKTGRFYGCTNYKQKGCKFTINKLEDLKPAENPTGSNAEESTEETTEMTPEVFKELYYGLLKAHPAIVAEVMQAQGFKSVDDLPTGTFGMVQVIEAIQDRLKQPKS